MSETSGYVKDAVLADLFKGTDLSAALGFTTLSPADTLYLSLHHSYPGDVGGFVGLQTTSEMGTTATATGYPGYARIAIIRTSAGWSASSGTNFAANVAGIPFPQRVGVGTNGVARWVGLGTASTGSGGKLLWCFPLSALNAVWLYAQSVNSIAADTISVASKHDASAETFTDGDQYEVAPLYGSSFPTTVVAMGSSQVYTIKAGSLPGGVSPYSPAANINTTMKLQAGGVDLDFTSDGSFRMIKSGALTITNGGIPTINASSLAYFLY